MNHDDEYDAGEDEFGDMVAELTEICEAMGLYATSMMVQSSASKEQMNSGTSIKGLIEDGEQFIIKAEFRIGDIAWSDRTLRPKQFEFDQQFDRIAPTEEEVMLEHILSEGMSLFSLDDCDDEDDV